MEPQGAGRIFQCSKATHNVPYAKLYGDGDSKTHQVVKHVYQEDNIEVVKQECIGHVQKRVGTTALRKLKEDPGIGGKGKLR